MESALTDRGEWEVKLGWQHVAGLDLACVKF